jgi:adenylosuccinate lyase
LSKVLSDFAEDMRLLYSSRINKITSLDAVRLKGSSADAGKNNPVNWENNV